MLFRYITILSFAFFCLLPSLISSVYAIENPLNLPNNKIGIHILFTEELGQAAKLVNSHGGDWGYVTIPIQSGDKDLVKWQGFFNDAKKLHVIPIIRLATEGDYFNTKVWRKPTETDIVDFANFLDSLTWPTKNRYVIVYNEVNRFDEWGGTVHPEEYAKILTFAQVAFKVRSPDYFIISAGLDNAAPDQTDQYMNEYEFMQAMDNAVPGIWSHVDGIASHSYPNPGFSQPPEGSSKMGVDSFHYEQQLVQSFGNKSIPVFITETGWSSGTLTDDTRGKYLQETLSSFWNDKDIVAITPFLLTAGGGQFNQFSFIRQDGIFTRQYQVLESFPKIKGLPSFSSQAFAASTQTAPLDIRDFSKGKESQKKIRASAIAEDTFKWLLRL